MNSYAEICKKIFRKSFVMHVELEPIAYFQSPFSSKFGIPRQSGQVPSLVGKIVFEPGFRNAEALRGLEGFDYLWLIWGFSANSHASAHLTVRPPRLGGNVRMGVFATRSPFRPNPIGLSSVKIARIDYDAPEAPVVCVKGADLMDGTPIFDIKPYLAYTDAHPEARCGFVDQTEWKKLHVKLCEKVKNNFTEQQQEMLCRVLELDPRPHYHNDEGRIYGMSFEGCDVRFTVSSKNELNVLDVRPIRGEEEVY